MTEETMGDVVEQIASFVKEWNGSTRDGDTSCIAEEIRNRFAYPDPEHEATRPAPSEASGDVVGLIRRMRSYLDRNKLAGHPTGISLMESAIEALSATPAPQADAWQPIETAPKDGSEFLSVGPDAPGKVQPTRWLSPGPYSTENGKNAEGERRYQWPDGFYWAGYDGFVGPVRVTQWRPLPALPLTESQTDAD